MLARPLRDCLSGSRCLHGPSQPWRIYCPQAGHTAEPCKIDHSFLKSKQLSFLNTSFLERRQLLY